MFKMNDYMRCDDVNSNIDFLAKINETFTLCDDENKCKHLEIIIDDRRMLKYIKENILLPKIINNMLTIEDFDSEVIAEYRCLHCGSILKKIWHKKKGYYFFGCPKFKFEKATKIITTRANVLVFEDYPNPEYEKYRPMCREDEISFYNKKVEMWRIRNNKENMIVSNSFSDNKNVISFDKAANGQTIKIGSMEECFSDSNIDRKLGLDD